MATTQKQYVNGFYMSEKTGTYGTFYKVRVNVDEFIKQLKELKGADGYASLTLNERKDADKFGNKQFSMAVDTFTPAPKPAATPQAKPQPKPALATANVGDESDGDNLPF